MNAPTWIAIASPIVGLLIAVTGNLFGLGPNRAKAASDYATTASSFAATAKVTNDKLDALTVEVRGIKTAVEEMVDVVRIDVLPLIEGDHPAVAAKLRVVKQNVEAVL